MKGLKTICVCLALSIGIVAILSSCSGEDDGPVMPGARSVAGMYKGDMICSVMGQESVFGDMVFDIDAIDDTTVNIEISSFGNPPMQVSVFVIPGVKVTVDKGSYILASTEFEQESNGKKVSGTIQGFSVDDIISISFSLNYGAMPMPMICSFSAPKI